MIPAGHETQTLYYTSVLPLLGVDDLDSFIYVLDGHDRQHRPENLPKVASKKVSDILRVLSASSGLTLPSASRLRARP